MTDLSPQAQAIIDAYENTTDKYKALAAVLRALIDEEAETLHDPYGYGKVGAVLVDDILKIIEELEQF